MENEMQRRPEIEGPQEFQEFSLRELVRAQEEALRLGPIVKSLKRRGPKHAAAERPEPPEKGTA